MFETLQERVTESDFRGCAFVRATSEGPLDDSKVSEVCRAARAWTRELLVELARNFGAAEPKRLGQQLALLYDGVLVAASVDRNPGAAAEARSIQLRQSGRRVQPTTTRKTADNTVSRSAISPPH